MDRHCRRSLLFHAGHSLAKAITNSYGATDWLVAPTARMCPVTDSWRSVFPGHIDNNVKYALEVTVVLRPEGSWSSVPRWSRSSTTAHVCLAPFHELLKPMNRGVLLIRVVYANAGSTLFLFFTLATGVTSTLHFMPMFRTGDTGRQQQQPGIWSSTPTRCIDAYKVSFHRIVLTCRVEWLNDSWMVLWLSYLTAGLSPECCMVWGYKKNDWWWPNGPV